MNFGPVLAPYLFIAFCVFMLIWSGWWYYKGYAAGKAKANSNWLETYKRTAEKEGMHFEESEEFSDFVDELNE